MEEVLGSIPKRLRTGRSLKKKKKREKEEVEIYIDVEI